MSFLQALWWQNPLVYLIGHHYKTINDQEMSLILFTFDTSPIRYFVLLNRTFQTFNHHGHFLFKTILLETFPYTHQHSLCVGPQFEDYSKMAQNLEVLFRTWSIFSKPIWLPLAVKFGTLQKSTHALPFIAGEQSVLAGPLSCRV